jgi:hypothetical protein
MPTLARPVSKLDGFGKLRHRRDDWLFGDADKSLTFSVTAKHIKAGEPRMALTCPAALAIKDVLGQRFDVVVNLGVVKVFDSKNKLCMRFATSNRLRKDYGRFDAELTPNFEPGGEYELLPVPGWLRLGRKRVVSKKTEDSDSRKAKPKKALPKRWIVGHKNVALLRDNQFFSPHIRPEDIV